MKYELHKLWLTRFSVTKGEHKPTATTCSCDMAPNSFCRAPSSYFKAKVSENINIDFLEQGKSNLKLLPSRIQHCFTSGVNSYCKIHATYMIPDLFSFLVWQHIHKTYDTSPIFPVFLWAGFNFTLARRWPGIADVLASICFVQLELGLQFYWLWIMP